MLLNNGTKSSFIMFILKTNAVKFKDIEIMNRRPFTNKDFRELMSNPKADIYGAKYPEPKQQPQSHRHFSKLFYQRTERRVKLNNFGNYPHRGNRNKRFRSDSFSSSENMSDQEYHPDIFETDLGGRFDDDL